jgi:hypothetical protein
MVNYLSMGGDVGYFALVLQTFYWKILSALSAKLGRSKPEPRNKD